MLIFFGTRATKIDSLKMQNCSCPNCNSENALVATKYGRYFHVFFLPIFPTSLRTIVECRHCYKTYDGTSFEKALADGSNEKIELIEKKRPLWHSCGCLLIVLFMAASLVTTCTGYLFNKDEIDKDLDNPLKKMYEADFAKMTTHPNCEVDSVSCAVKDYFKMIMTDELEQEKFEYFSKVEGSKVLILLKIDDMKKIEPSERMQIVGFAKDAAQQLKNMEDKQYYIGVEGRWNTVLVYTPNEKDLGGRFADEKYLYEFYNNKEKARISK